MEYRQGSDRWRWSAACGVLLACGVVASLWGSATARAHEAQVAGEVLDRRMQLVEQAVADEVRRHLDALRSTAAAAGSHQDLTAAEYADATAPLADAGLAGVTSVVFTAPVPHDGLAAA